MAYKTDGSPHHNGVKGEENLLNYFNDKLNYSFISDSINKSFKTNKKFKEFKFIKKGGTQNRTDIFCENNKICISIKSKKKDKNKYKGTFDLINTSSINDFICENEEFNKKIVEWNNWIAKKKNGNYDYKLIKKEVEDNCRSILNAINGSQIDKIFKKITEIESGNIEVIRDYINNIDEDISSDSIHFLEQNWFNNEIKNNIDFSQKINSLKTSSFIKCKNNENSVFRIRVVTNNGVSA